VTDSISLADVLRRANSRLSIANSDDLQRATSPTLEDLAQCVLFSPGDGRIWLKDQRMLLMHASALGALRSELIASVGVDRARALLTSFGYTSGARDAELIRRLWPDSDLSSAFEAGPRLHSLEGVVKVTTIRFQFDVDRGTFYGEFLWHDSSEAAHCIQTHGLVSSPCCWMQAGYASGYASEFIGKPILYREVECSAMGAPHCRVIGRPMADWEDNEHDLSALHSASPHPFEHGSAEKRTRRGVSAPGSATPEASDRAIVGASAAFNAARQMLERVAATDATVLLTGESGVGKELFSYSLHECSARRSGPFIAVNCAAIPDSLVEAELFGVERGAFTGAIATRIGRFERASGGTLFLDEIGCLTAVAQSKLLRVLQEGVIDRVGGQSSIKVDVRVVAATNVSLRTEVERGRFREDLFYRINVFPVELPPLRERRDDIPLLLEHFLQSFRSKHRRNVPGFTRRAIETLLAYNYPGNVRELQNLVERGVICAGDGEPVDLAHLFRPGELMRAGAFSIGCDGALREADFGSDTEPDVLGEIQPGSDLVARALDLGISLSDVMDRMCAEALRRSDGNVSKAARTLNVTRNQLDYHIAKKRIEKLNPSASGKSVSRETAK
jgi:DNA-binding NtrC family response regulator/predicted hydrocarbon binding protein